MKKLLLASVACGALAWSAPSEAYRVVASCPSVVVAYQAGQAGVDPVVDTNGNICISSTSDPAASTSITASATGTTGATAATLAGVASKTTYICGFSMRSTATAAVTGNATVAGTITGTMNFTHWTGPVASAIGTTEQYFYPCIPASAVNTGIVVTSPAPGTAGVISVTAWGFQK